MMSKLLALAFFGAAAAHNHTSGNGTVTTTAANDNLVVGQNADDSDNTTFQGVAGKFLVEVDVTISLDLGNVTSDEMTQQTEVESGQVASGSGACQGAQNAPNDNPALTATCDVVNSLWSVFLSKQTQIGASVGKVTVLKVTASRRSLTETEARRLTNTALVFGTSCEVNSFAQGGYLAQALGTDGSLNSEGLSAGLIDALAVYGRNYGIVTASATVGDVCNGMDCSAAVPATFGSTETTTADAIKTGLGLAAAVVSGLFLF